MKMEAEQKVIEETALAVPGKATALVITTDEELSAAGKMLTEIKKIQKQINASFDPVIKTAHSAHREAVALKKTVSAPLVQAEGIIKPKIAQYAAEQEKIRKAEEDRIRKEAEDREKAEAEKRALEEEKRLKEAADLEVQGKTEEAEAVLDAPVLDTPAAPLPVKPKAAAKVEGVAVKQIWKFRIVDADKIPREYMLPNETLIGKIVRSSSGAVQISGVEIYSEASVSARG